MWKFIVAIAASVVAGIILLLIDPQLRSLLFVNKNQPTNPVAVLEYRIVRGKPTADLDTLGPDNRVRSDEDVCFQVKLERAGTIYLLHQGPDGFLKWINPVADDKPQSGSAAEWLRIPENQNQWVALDTNPVPESFLLIYVPTNIEWSIVGAILPQSFTMHNGFPAMPPEGAVRIREFITSNTVRLASLPSRVERMISYKLVEPPNIDKIACYEFRLEHY